MSDFGKPKPCQNNCGKYIYFDRDSEKGHPNADKWIPLEYDNDAGIRTNEPHQCPNKSKNTPPTTLATQADTIIALLKEIDGKLNRLLVIEGQ